VKQRLLLLSWLGALLFLAGILIGLALSGAYTWSEIEARAYSSFSGDARLRLNCPLMLSSEESGVVRAEIINLIDKNIEPVITVQISHGKVPREIKQTLSLVPLESKTLEWNVDYSDAIFERLILVNVFQSRYSENPSRWGSCGILIFSLFGLTGMETFSLVFVISQILIIAGGFLWLYAHRPLDQFSGNIVRINSVLFSMTIFALLSTVAHWWGLALFFDALMLLLMGVIFTEFVLFSQRHRE
jgi:hypothetical protein